MPRFSQYTLANAPESSKPLLARVHKALGFVPNPLATFAESPVVLNKGFVPETTVAAFLAAGYSKAQLLEVVGHVGLKVLANYTHALTGVPLDEAFQPQQWDAPELEVA